MQAKNVTDKGALRAKVIQVRVSDGAEIGPALEAQLNEFLGAMPDAAVQSTQLHMLDIGGPSQADIVVICTIFYAAV